MSLMDVNQEVWKPSDLDDDCVPDSYYDLMEREQDFLFGRDDWKTAEVCFFEIRDEMEKHRPNCYNLQHEVAKNISATAKENGKCEYNWAYDENLGERVIRYWAVRNYYHDDQRLVLDCAIAF